MKSEAVAGNSNVHFKTALSARIPSRSRIPLVPSF